MSEPARDRPSRGGRRAKKALFRIWARAKTLVAGLPAGSVFEGVPDDRLQARLSVYQWAALSVADRRVLDLGRGGRYSEAALAVGGARRVSRVFEQEIETGSSADTGRLECILAIDDATGPPRIDLDNAAVGSQDERSGLMNAGLDGLISRASPGAQFLLAWGAWAGAPVREGDRPAWLRSIDEVRRSFLRCRRFLHHSPPGYRPDWSDRSPARARAQEYRFEEVSLEAPLGDAIGEIFVLSMPRRGLLDTPGPSGALRLHVGAGMERMEGWLNVDLLPLPGVDIELDVTKDFVFRDVEAIYAEHFLEHLEVLDVLRFFEQAHAALGPGGRLRLSTPNLDWVWKTHYQVAGSSTDKIDAALTINRAFYGWEHRFLWNREILEQALRSCGFDDIEWPEYGESRFEHLRGLERHERYPDEPALPHVLIVEAGKGSLDPARLEAMRKRFQSELVDQIKGWYGVDLAVQTSTPRVTES